MFAVGSLVFVALVKIAIPILYGKFRAEGVTPPVSEPTGSVVGLAAPER